MIPFLAEASRAIQEETGYSNYVSAFLTPPRSQGLLHHWDQQMGVIAQVKGVKRWQLWRPECPAPMREYQESFRVWNPDFIPKWETLGPDMEIALEPGQSLVLPRGWVHNPHALDSDEGTVHLTFAVRERTPLWLAEKLIASAIENPEFRRVVMPSDLLGERALADTLRVTRRALVEHLEALDVHGLARAVRRASVTEMEPAR
ncbi:cupin domain-containing protein [Streptomyces sp. NPDC079167]|uniref:JmjC domain-containing protein n=1 Tax=Streptomyces sp. NPDC079167 TaxID=3154513 RepID=UPI00343E9929